MQPSRAPDLVASLTRLSGSQARLDWLVAESRTWPRLDESLRTEANRVAGCLSRLWLVAEYRAGGCWFRADSDSRIVRVLAGLVCRTYAGHEVVRRA